VSLFIWRSELRRFILHFSLGIGDLPARVIYEEVLPEVVSRFMSPETEVPYWRGSPYGGKGWDTADPTIGDVVSRGTIDFSRVRGMAHIRVLQHQWNVWGGAGHPYQDYDVLGGRFVRFVLSLDVPPFP